LKPDADRLVKGVMAAGGHQVTAIHLETDHSYSDQRIALETQVLNWLGSLP
jgi:hypothetical protein